MNKHLKTFLQPAKRVYLRLANLRDFLWDYRQCVKHSHAIQADTPDKAAARIMLLMHSLEKGLSMKEKRDGFGTEKANALADHVRSYLGQYGPSKVTDTAINVLDAYLKCDHSTKNERVRRIVRQLISENEAVIAPGIGGVKEVSEPDFRLSFDEIRDFYAQRSSVREYSDRPITEEEIEKAKSIAATTPTACNRQTSRVYSFKGRETMEKILAAQLGDQGWCKNADTLFVVTSDQCYFGGLYERMEPLVDGGLYAMNFVMGLHAQKIATCFKMFVRDPRLETEFKAATGIPDSEVPIVLILAGHYSGAPSHSPVSHRLNNA